MITIPGKIPITIHPTFWLIACLIAYFQSEHLMFFPIWIGIVFLAIITHELGHAVTASLFGKQAKIDLVGFGGLSSYEGKKLSAWKNLLITLNGPLAGAGLVAVFFVLNQSIPEKASATLYHEFVRGSLAVNFLWTIFNLFPILPLDGGHLVRIFFEGVFGLFGLRLASILSTLFCLACAGLAFIDRSLLIVGILFLLFLPENIRFVQLAFGMARKDRDPKMIQYFEEGEKEFQLGRWEEALMRFQVVRGGEKRGNLYQKASEYVAEILSNRGEYQEAFKVLEKVKKGLDPSLYPMYQKLAYANKNWKDALTFGEKFFAVHNNPDVALTNAFCCGIQQDANRAVLWLKAAEQAGLKEVGTILKRKEFDAIRKDASFQELVNQEES